MLQVALQPGLPEGRRAYLRPLAGGDEASIDDRSEAAAERLLDRLLVAAPDTRVGPGRAAELTISDRDRLLAALYRQLYGERVEGSARCAACGEPFELAFTLGALTQGDETHAAEHATGPDADGVYTLPGGARFRLPTGEDLRSVAALAREEAPAALYARCLVDGAEGDREAVEAAMAAVGPVLDVDLAASCPGCGAAQRLRFDLPSYLLGALAAEKVWLRREVHSIATAYGWSLEEILGLCRDDRRGYVRLIEAERAARSGW